MDPHHNEMAASAVCLAVLLAAAGAHGATPAWRQVGPAVHPLRLRGGSSVADAPGAASAAGAARAAGARGGGWRGAQSYLETTGINITATAGSIAAYRSAVTLCNSTYLDDPFAALFAREMCPERYKEILLLPPPKLVRFAVRTKFFDNFIRDCVHRHGIKQVPPG